MSHPRVRGSDRKECHPHAFSVIPAHAGIQSIINPMNYVVYILANKRNGTLYIGSTNNLIKRVYEHKQKLVNGFTKQYSLNQLVYYEIHDTALTMVTRERQLKHWDRLWKLKLIDAANPNWQDLYPTIV